MLAFRLCLPVTQALP